jgi:hypothetical protein
MRWTGLRWRRVVQAPRLTPPSRTVAHWLQAVFAVVLIGAVAPAAVADEGGVSLWLTGQFGSLAAVPPDPGWSLPIIYYHGSIDASGGKNFKIGGQITAGVDGRADLLFLAPTYTLETPVLAGRASLSLAGAFGNMDVSADATLTGPRGNVLRANPSDSLFSGSDLYPMASLRWNDGNHNYMTYGMADIPVGDYEPGRLANIGINHWAVDGGGGYTYFNPKNGRELSAVVGLTYNFENPDTHYQNGIDFHLDWGASQFLSEHWHVGLVGYVYQQVTSDSGSGATLGDFKSRVAGIGPQVGYFFELWERTWYVNVKGYYEFAAQNRPDGWNVWLTLVIPLSAAKK